MQTDSIRMRRIAAASGVPSVSPLAAPASAAAPENYGSGIFGPAYVREGRRLNGETFPLYAADGSFRSQDMAPGEAELADARAVRALEERDRQVRRKEEGKGEAVGGGNYMYQTGPDGKPLSREDEALLHKLQARDAKVRNHEAAHIMAAGGQAGAPTYAYQTGPDGKRYAIGGSVNISMVRTGNPEQDARQANNVYRAAMATGEPSSRDMQAAAHAQTREMEAGREQWNRALGAYAAQGILQIW